MIVNIVGNEYISIKCKQIHNGMKCKQYIKRELRPRSESTLKHLCLDNCIIKYDPSKDDMTNRI